MRTLNSYLEDRWVSGSGDGAVLHDAVSGAPIATASTAGLDLGRALQHARQTGGPALRALTFAERGALLRRLSEVVHAHRDELFDLARQNSGNTRGDAKFDVDGASGTLAYYARLGEQLGDKRVLLDGEAEKIGRSARFAGQHVLLPRGGVALHINAFNFPAWGMCEKAAVSLLAGVPFLAKPATSTATVAVRIVELWVEAGVLPAGAVSLLAGGAGDLLDHVGPQDAIAFTGSGDTGRRIKGHPKVLEHNVPVNVEADSLNAAVLGPEVDDDTLQMFYGDVVRDIVQKAGQKCTAIRRILVPHDRVDDVIAELSDRLSRAGVGDPDARGVEVGPLATASQQRDVRALVDTLASTATRVYGDPAAVPDAGFFVAPQLFRDDRGVKAPFVHQHEIFGPVAVILPWDGSATGAIDIVSAGGGGLVCSVYADDVAWAGEVLLGIAPWHGRVVWGSAKIADQSFGPGTVLPGFVHGGPGKAGGGEELGGLRGLRFYQVRTAIQGDRALLERVLG